MNDRYLFRGKRLDNNEWLKGQLCHDGYRAWIACGIGVFPDNTPGGIALLSNETYEVDPISIGQCTGYECYQYTHCKRDEENKQLLFEADIIKFTAFDSNDCYAQHIGVVYWDSGQYWVDCTSREGDDGAYSLSGIMICDDCIEIIGNIHDNPEMLEATPCPTP